MVVATHSLWPRRNRRQLVTLRAPGTYRSGLTQITDRRRIPDLLADHTQTRLEIATGQPSIPDISPENRRQSVPHRAFVPDLPVHTPLRYVLAALAVSFATGLFAGVGPARRAAGLDPVDALRTD